MDCPQCQYPAEQGDSFCAYCGLGLSPASQQVVDRPASLPAPKRAKSRTPVGLLAALGIFLAKFGKPILLALGKLKFVGGLFKFKALGSLLTTGGSMFVSLWFWALMLGWIGAAGLIGLLFVHEMGHAIVLRALGVPFSAPLFIPFMGAVIGMKQMPRDVGKEALMAFGGPFLGTLGALACLYIFWATGNVYFLFFAQIGFLINLFNLVPVSPLDGGRIVGAISPKIWLLGVPLLLYMYLRTGHFLILFILFMAVPRAIAGWRIDPSEAEYYKVSAGVRIAAGVAYVGLAGFLVFMMSFVMEQMHALKPALGGGPG